MWLGVLLPELEERGLKRGQMLDVGCGTGRAFEPMLRRGWEVVGCDLAPAMIEEARRKYGEAVGLHLADARQLPVLGEFELVLALNDVVNYILEVSDLEQAFAGMQANLAPGGLILFDANTLRIFHERFTIESAPVRIGKWRWTGQTDRLEAGGLFEAEVSGDDTVTQVHRERHWNREGIQRALATAELKLLAALGQQDDGKLVVLTKSPNEWRDHKVIYIASKNANSN